MKIKTKLSLQFSIIVTTILALFSAGIYIFSAEYRAHEFNDRLTNRAATIGGVLNIVPVSDTILFQRIVKNNVNMLFKENLHIYDYNSLDLLFQFREDSTEIHFSKAYIKQIKEKGAFVYPEEGDRETTGIVYPKAIPRYIIVASAIDLYGRNVLNSTKLILTVGVLICMLLVIVSAFLFSRQALKPVSRIVNQVDKITATRFHSRVVPGENNDELAHLARTFNKMLDRLETAYVLQKNFVSNASHELRTPLTSMKGQIEVTLLKERSHEDYIAVLNSLMADTENMTTLMNGFLEMAESTAENKLLKLQPVRIDDLLFELKNEIKKRKKDSKISISFDESISEESCLTLEANPHLLKILFNNLIDNACKFSDDKRADVLIKHNQDFININISDHGIGIPEAEIGKISESFFRASNAKKHSGHGIGLSIVSKILELHNGYMEIASEENIGTTINVFIPYTQTD